MTVLHALVIAIFSTTSCFAQAGTVIFYTPANTGKSEAASLLPKSQQPFTGWLFDGQQRLAHVRPGRFLVFHLNSGAHTFTVPYHSDRPGKGRPGKDSLLINVVNGSQNCVLLYAKMTNLELFPLEFLNSRIEEVPCQQVQRNAAHLKPIEIKRVDPAVRSELDATTSLQSEDQQH